MPKLGVKVPAPALNVPPEPLARVQVPPVCSPVIKSLRSIVAVELSQTEMKPSAPAFTALLIFTVAILVSLGQPLAATIYLN